MRPPLALLAYVVLAGAWGVASPDSTARPAFAVAGVLGALGLVASAFRSTAPRDPRRGVALVQFGLAVAWGAVSGAFVVFQAPVMRSVAGVAASMAFVASLVAAAGRATWAGGGRGVVVLRLGVVSLVLVAVAGAVAAAEESFRWHPTLALTLGLVAAGGAVAVLLEAGSPSSGRLATAVLALFLLQPTLGFVNQSFQSPVALRVVHHVVAEVLWASYVALALQGSGAPDPAENT